MQQRAAATVLPRDVEVLEHAAVHRQAGRHFLGDQCLAGAMGLPYTTKCTASHTPPHKGDDTHACRPAHGGALAPTMVGNCRVY